jgi:hypothetical protein
VKRCLDLDPASRRTLRWFVLRMGLAIVMAMVAAAYAEQVATRFLLVFQVLCFSTSLFATAFALRDHQKPGVLGFWDEALAFGALALLAHAVRTLVGP